MRFDPAHLSNVFGWSLVLASCSSGGATTPPPSPSGATDLAMTGSDPDGGTREDLGKTGPDLRMPLDPATCPQGASDGCCPLVVGASRDPDCPKLDCAKLAPGAAIPIDVVGIGAGRGGYGQAAMAWTGSDLALAFTTQGDTDQGRVIFQRRNEAGDLTYGPIDSQLPNTATPTVAGPTVLIYEPTQRAYIVGHTASLLRYAAFGLDLMGNTTWGQGLGELCNALWLSMDGYSINGEAFIGSQNMTCAGSTYWPRVDALTFDGKDHRTWAIGDGMRPNLTAKGAFAYDRSSKRLFAVWNRLYEGSIGARYVDPMSGPMTPTTLHARPGGIDNYEHLGVVSDGQRFGVLVERRVSYSGYTRHFEHYDPVSGMVSTPLSTPGGGQAMLPPSMLWTGDGYLAAAMFFDGPSTPLSEPQKITSYIFSFAKDGTLRETIPVDTGPAIYPKLAWAGGRVALTWVRPTGMNAGHYLKFFSCF